MHNNRITALAIANCVHCHFFSEIFGRQRAWKSTSTWCHEICHSLSKLPGTCKNKSPSSNHWCFLWKPLVWLEWICSWIWQTCSKWWHTVPIRYDVCHDAWKSWKDLTGLREVPVTAQVYVFYFCSGMLRPTMALVGLWRKPANLHWLRRLEGFWILTLRGTTCKCPTFSYLADLASPNPFYFHLSLPFSSLVPRRSRWSVQFSSWV